MPLSPDDIATKRFPVSYEGYDPQQVISFLDQVAADYRSLMKRQLTLQLPPGDTALQALGGHMAEILESARRGADHLSTSSEQQAQAVLEAAQEKAERMQKQAQELLEDADQHLAAARREADKLVAAAERRAEEARGLLERQRQEAEMVRTRTEKEAAELVGTASEKANIMIEAASQRLDEAARMQAAAEQDALVFKEWLRKQTTCIDEMMRTSRDMKMLVDRLHGDTPASSGTKLASPEG